MSKIKTNTIFLYVCIAMIAVDLLVLLITKSPMLIRLSPLVLLVSFMFGAIGVGLSFNKKG